MGEDTALIGQVLHETYRLERVIGAGAMGSVYEASHLRLDRRFAIKVLQPSIATNPEAMARFRREARVTSALGHPHIVDVTDFNHTPDGRPYIVMELLAGEDLATRIQRKSRLDLYEAASILRQTASGLNAAHKSDVVHRDLKPQNIFLCQRGERDTFVKVLDFGISKVLTSTSKMTGTRALFGTPYYMAPEQAEQRTAEIGIHTDVYAMGTILFEMLAGQPPFSADTVPSLLYLIVHRDPPSLRGLRSDVSPEVEAVIETALRKRPEQRHPSMEAFWKALAAALDLGQGELDEPTEDRQHDWTRPRVRIEELHEDREKTVPEAAPPEVILQGIEPADLGSELHADREKTEPAVNPFAVLHPEVVLQDIEPAELGEQETVLYARRPRDEEITADDEPGFEDEGTTSRMAFRGSRSSAMDAKFDDSELEEALRAREAASQGHISSAGPEQPAPPESAPAPASHPLPASASPHASTLPTSLADRVVYELQRNRLLAIGVGVLFAAVVVVGIIVGSLALRDTSQPDVRAGATATHAHKAATPPRSEPPSKRERDPAGGTRPLASSRRLWLTSVPDGAEVFLDGKQLGHTPLSGVFVDTRKHKLLVLEPGYENWWKTIEPGAEELVFEALLKPIPAPPETPVAVASKVPAKRTSAPRGNKKAGGKAATKPDALLAAGRRRKPRARPAAGGCRLRIFTLSDQLPTWAYVYLDGKNLGRSPVLLDRVESGVHVVEVRREGYRTKREPVVLAPGKTKTIAVELQRE